MADPTSDDFYKVLGVTRDCGDDDLKRAYRKLAMKYHPDRNPADKEMAEEMFKRIGEAYETLSDREKRAAYDRYGKDGGSGGLGSQQWQRDPGFTFHRANDLFAHFFGGRDPFASMFDNDRNDPFGGGGFGGHAGFGAFGGFGGGMVGGTSISTVTRTGPDGRRVTTKTTQRTVNGQVEKTVEEIITNPDGTTSATSTSIAGPSEGPMPHGHGLLQGGSGFSVLRDEEDPELAAAIRASLQESTPPKAEEDRSAALAELEAMGFTDRGRNMQLLREHNGNVEVVVDALLV